MVLWITVMARCGPLLAATAVILAVAAPDAMAGQLPTEGFGLAGAAQRGFCFARQPVPARWVRKPMR